jgi:hypothetical protein
VGFLSKFSAFGIGAICFTFVIIFGYGFCDFMSSASVSFSVKDAILGSLWPDSATGVANWFGVAAFSYGIVPITYNIQESMAEPQLMVRATDLALRLVYILYITISNGVAILFTTTPHGFNGDVMEHLPSNSIATFTRLAMSAMILVTAPILVVPCGELLEGKFGIRAGANYSWRVLIRISIVCFTTAIGATVPGFVTIISLIGCCCVSLVSFVFPPLFFIRLQEKKYRDLNKARNKRGGQHNHNMTALEAGYKYHHDPTLKPISLAWDYMMLVWGTFCMVAASYLTIRNAFTAPA